jgi:hypothetical protein
MDIGIDVAVAVGKKMVGGRMRKAVVECMRIDSVDNILVGAGLDIRWEDDEVL